MHPEFRPKDFKSASYILRERKIEGGRKRERESDGERKRELGEGCVCVRQREEKD